MSYFNLTIIFVLVAHATAGFELSVIHLNDFHARYEEVNTNGAGCGGKTNCIGGLGRVKTAIYDILHEKPNSVVLNGGDNFQGTMYYNMFKYNITAEFLNTIPFDAIVLGNHEFDDGIEGATPFMKQLNAPIVVSNMNDTLEPIIQGLHSKSVVVERNGKKIGIIGVILKSVTDISNTGKLSFFDESESVNKEAERLVREEGVFTNIVLSHCGYDLEQLIAQKATNKIGLVVGAHSHTFLYTGSNPPGPDRPAGDYPTIERNKEGKIVLVTQASAYTKYLGNITVFYDEDGYVKDWSGSPVFMEHEIVQDPGYLTELQPYKDSVDEMGNQVIGSTLVLLDDADCWMGECTLGNFVTDAMVYAYVEKAPKGSWTKAAVAIANKGGMRSPIDVGNITYSELLVSQPFGNDLYAGSVTGQELLEIFEHSATQYSYGKSWTNINLLQVSGIKFVMDLRKPEGSRIKSLKVRCADCEIPVYEELNLEKSYRIIVSTFLMNGRDGYTMIPRNMKDVVMGQVDVDAYMEYLKARSPIFEEIEGRIEILGSELIRSKNLHT